MIINSYVFASSVSDADAQAFITAANITDGTQKNAVNNLVINLKAAGIWSKMKAVYPFVGGTASTHKWNLKDPRDLDAAFRLTFTGGWTHSSTGAKPNGTNAYADTYFFSSSLPLNSIHSSFYSRTNFTDNNYKINFGYLRPTPDSYSDMALDWNGAAVFRLNNGAAYTATTNGGNTIGNYIVSRTASNVIKAFKNNTIILNASDASSATSNNRSFYIGAGNNNGTPQYYTPNECSFLSIGDGLTDTEVLVYNQIVEGYQYALGRNVNPVNANYYNTSYENETNAFLYSSEITDNTQKTAINTLVVDMKGYGIWTKMKAIYPFVGGTATTHKWNLINPQDTNAAFRLSFIGGWTHSSNGALPNGVNGYANTFFNISSGFTLANKGSVGGYWRTVSPNSNNFFSINDPVGGNSSRFWIRHVSPFRDHYAGGITILRESSVTDYSGFSAMCRRSTTDMFAIKRDGTYITLTTSVTIGFSNTTLPFAANNSSGVYSGFSNAEIALGYISDDITQAEMTNLRTATINFQTTLGRQV